MVTAPAQAATLTNAASVSMPRRTRTPANNSSSVSTTVTASADLSVVKSGPPTVTAAGSVTYSLVVAQRRAVGRRGVSVTDTLPAGVTFVSATGTGWSCTNSGNVSVTCTRATCGRATSTDDHGGRDRPGPGGHPDQHGVGRLHHQRPEPGQQHVVGDDGGDGVGGLVDGEVRSGDVWWPVGRCRTRWWWRMRVRRTPRAVSVVDTLPAGVTFVSASGIGLVVRELGERLGDVHAVDAMRLVRSTDDHGRGDGAAQATTLTNTAAVSSTTADPVPGNNTVIGVDDGDGVGEPVVGEVRSGHCGGRWVGELLAGGVERWAVGRDQVSVVDTLPAGVTFVSASGPGWSCTNSGNVSVTCTRAGFRCGGDRTDDHGRGDGPGAGGDVDQRGVGVECHA